MPRLHQSLAVPVLLLLSITPGSEQKLGQLAAFLQATQSIVQTLRSGLETFYNSLVEVSFIQNPPPRQNTTPEFSTQPVQEKEEQGK
ncbi:MAG: hypothetical protein ACPLRH_02365 [Desulfotomaculales bacterium]